MKLLSTEQIKDFSIFLNEIDKINVKKYQVVLKKNNKALRGYQSKSYLKALEFRKSLISRVLQINEN